MKTAKQQFVTDAVLGVIAFIMLFLVFSTLVFADSDKNPKCPPAESCTKPAPPSPAEVIKNPVYITVERCDEYQIRVLTVRGGNSVDAETLGYCDLEQAQNALANINAMAYVKFPKGLPVRQFAFPLF